MGSVCSAIIVCKLFNLPDPRLEGSKNPGATNVLRIAGKQYATYVLVGDLLKGLLPVLLAQALNEHPAVCSVVVVAAVIGHMYPIFFEFNGGKGVATAIGALFGLQLFIGLMVAATWLLVAKVSKYSSLASLIALTLSPIYALFIIKQVTIFPPLFLMVILIIYKHRNNITRLMDGTEPKIMLKQTIIEEIVEDTPNNLATDAHETVNAPMKKNVVVKETIVNEKVTVEKKKKATSPSKKVADTKVIKVTKKKVPEKPVKAAKKTDISSKTAKTPKVSATKVSVSKSSKDAKPKAKAKPKKSKDE